MYHNNNIASDSVHSEIFEIFMDLNQYDKRAKDQAAAQRRLAARRAIEQHYEKKKLEEAISDYWFEK